MIRFSDHFLFLLKFYLYLIKINGMKRMYYVPGLISALLIPILFWFYGNQRTHEPYTVMDLGLPAKVKKGMENSLNTFEPYRKWNYKKIVVQPNTALQNQQYYVSELKSFRQEMKRKLELNL